jgi:HPt (histidine-containing phosphotransfer) domain-containing protein
MKMGREQTSPYPVLATLLEGDDRKIRAILWVFHLSVSKDVQAMEQAAARGQWFVVLRLAHRISIGCRQIGEESMAEELVSQVVAAIEHARTCAATASDDFMHRFRGARDRLVKVLDRAAAYAAVDELDSVA